jgi:hypothetical protein
MSSSNLFTRISELEQGYDRLERRLAALETGKPAFRPTRGRPPRAKNRPKEIDVSAHENRV